MTNHLTEKQIIAFKEKGFIQLDSFLPEDLCSNLRVEVDELVCKRKKQEAPLVISYHEMGMLTSYPPMISIIQQLMKSKFAMHHIHAARHDAGERASNWHHDYEQIPNTNRSHLMVHVFYYLDGLNGEIGDLLLIPGSQNQISQRDALNIFETKDLPGSLCIDNTSPGSAIIVHSGLFHARRPKAGGENNPRYFIDISYCQNGILWPGYPLVEEVNTLALKKGFDRSGDFKFLYDTNQFFDQKEFEERYGTRLEKTTGSMCLQIKSE